MKGMRTVTADRFTSKEVCEIVGIPYRNLDYMVRTGVVTPTVNPKGTGHRRRFTVDELREVWIAVRLEAISGYELVREYGADDAVRLLSDQLSMILEELPA